MATKPEVSFLGLGAMGFGMATNLSKKGFKVTGFDVWAPTLQRFAAVGGLTATTPAEAVANKPICVCMVATSIQAQDVLIGGKDAAAPALPQGAVILLCSTVSCSYAQDLEKQLAVKRPDLLLVDCPVSGGIVRAADGTLSIMAGASNAAIEAGRAVLIEMADTERLYVVDGGIGAGSNTKMVHQVLAANQILSSSEAWGFAMRLGLPSTEETLKALLESPGRSWMLGHRGPRMLTEYKPIASAIAIILKDTGIITSEARKVGFATLMASVAENAGYAAVARGYGPDDDSSLVRLYTDGQENLPRATATGISPAESLRLVVGLLKGIHLASTAEMLAFAHHVNLDLDMILGLCINAAGGSGMLEIHGPAIVAVLRNSAATTGQASEQAVETLESIYEDLAAAVDAAQQIKIPLYLGTQALNLIRTALLSVGAGVQKPEASSIVKLWAP